MTISILSILIGVIAKYEIHIKRLHHQITGVSGGLITIGMIGLGTVIFITALQIYARNYKYMFVFDLCMLISVIGYILQFETRHLDIHRIPFHALGHDFLYVGASGVAAASIAALCKVFVILRKQSRYPGTSEITTDEQLSSTDMSIAQ